MTTNRWFGVNVLQVSCQIVIYFIVLCYPLLVTAQSCIKAEFVIAIDIGHSKKQVGARSARGIGEFYFNQRIAKLLWKNLQQQGFTKAFLINPEGNNMSLPDRTVFAEQGKAHLFLSLHHDSVQPQYLSTWIYEGKSQRYSDLFHGYSLFYSEQNAQPATSLAFAHLLGTELLANQFKPTLHHAENIKGENRELIDIEKGIYRFDELVVLRTAKMPAVLLECGVIVNRHEEILINKASYQRKLVAAITNAIINQCETSE